jgi:hypothetical protein
LKKSLISSIDACLEPIGFKRRNHVWNRTSGLFLDVIDIQKSKVGEEITINAGVLNLRLNEKFGLAKDLQFVKEQHCTVRVRIGFLIGDRDIWWSLGEPNLPEILRDSILKFILPFFDSMHSDASMECFLTDAAVEKKHYPPPIIYLALLRNELGQNISACSLLMTLQKSTSGPWQKRIDKLIDKLDCTKAMDASAPLRGIH